MVISLGPLRDRPRRRLRGGSRLSASTSNLITAGSEIAAGRIALFTPAHVAMCGHWSLLLSTMSPWSPIWTVDVSPRLPGFHRAPSLYAARTFLSPEGERPSFPDSYARQLSTCKPAGKAG
jgi:hypothetical protein